MLVVVVTMFLPGCYLAVKTYLISHDIAFRQIERDCEFLEAEKIMDYSLLVGLHFRDDNTYDKMGLSPFLLRTGIDPLPTLVHIVKVHVAKKLFKCNFVSPFRQSGFISK